MALCIGNQTFKGECSEVETFPNFKCDCLCPTLVFVYPLNCVSHWNRLCFGSQIPFPALLRTSLLFISYLFHPGCCSCSEAFFPGRLGIAGGASGWRPVAHLSQVSFLYKNGKIIPEVYICLGIQRVVHWETLHQSFEIRINSFVPAAVVQLLSRVQLFETPWARVHQAPLSMGFRRQEYWSGLLCPS